MLLFFIVIDIFRVKSFGITFMKVCKRYVIFFLLQILSGIDLMKKLYKEIKMGQGVV
jgi:hypothetical protein